MEQDPDAAPLEGGEAAAAAGAGDLVAGGAAATVARVVAAAAGAELAPSAKVPALPPLALPVVFEEAADEGELPLLDPPDGVDGVEGVFALPGPEPQEPTGALRG